MSHPVSEEGALVTNTHSTDFAWRVGGAIALHALQGHQAHVVCSSFDERGESAKLQRKDDMTEEVVKQMHREETQAVAEILGASTEFLGIDNYPLRADKETLFRLTDVYRRAQSHFVLTHSLHDPYNYGHPLASHLAWEARTIAQAEGYRPGGKIVVAPPVYCFEPHQSEQYSQKLDMLLGIIAVRERKYQAIQCVQGQEHLWEYYIRVALQCGVQAKRNIGIAAVHDIAHSEALQSIFSRITKNLA